jgi:diguanylate cyclase (GGDEF)-like protein
MGSMQEDNTASAGEPVAIMAVLAGFLAAILMTVFEAIKMQLYPRIDIWISHFVTIFFTSILAALAAIFAGYRLGLLNRKLKSLNRQLHQYNSELSSEILKRQQAESHIMHMAHHDPLTGLPNRILLEDRISRSIAHAQRARQLTAILFIDLDKFKSINDTLGHAIGDQMLQQVADRLRHCLRDDDTVARIGGDEFVICLYGLTDRLAALPIADKILRALNTRFEIADHSFDISGSIGISIIRMTGKLQASCCKPPMPRCTLPSRSAATTTSITRRRAGMRRQNLAAP